MKLDVWLKTPNADGTRKRRDEFASRIGVHPQMISGYCSGKTCPSMDTQRKIFTETGGAVTPNDWAGVDVEVFQ